MTHVLRAIQVGLDDVVLILSADQLAPLSAEQELEYATARKTANAEPNLPRRDLTVRATAYSAEWTHWLRLH